MPEARAGLFRAVVLVAAGLVAGIVAFTATAGFTDARAARWALGLAAAAAMIGGLATRPGLGSGLASVPRPFQVAFAVGSVVTLVQLLWLTAFIIDPYRTTWRDDVLRPWATVHSCVSAYWTAAEKATTAPSLYVDTLYRPPTPASGIRKPNLGPFIVDVFEYPPTFLPLPRLMAWATGDFWGFRRLWFALNLGGVVAGLIAVALRLDKALGTHTLWLTPWVIAAPSMVGTLQVGNVQLLFIVASAAAMLLFERRQPVLGGLILGYAIASKLYPGVLVVYLLLRRDGRAVAWTALWGVALSIATVVDIGWTPIATFLDQLPKILSGEAFPGLFQAIPIALNESIPGLVFKLGLLGVPGMSFPASRIVGWIYTVVMLIALVRIARRPMDARLAPLVWIAILIQATLRSPFLPTYGAFPSLWEVTLLAGIAWHRRSGRTLAVVAWLVLALSLGRSYGVAANALLTLAHTVVALVLAFYVVPRVVAVPEPKLA